MRIHRRLIVAVVGVVLGACFGLIGSAGSAGAAGWPRAGRLPLPVPCAGCWRPALNTSWQWQLSSVPAAPYLDVTMYDIDGFDATAGDVARLHATKGGRKVVCYISAGTHENWRPDAGDFPAGVLGDDVDGWPGERWLDIRQYTGKLGDILEKRMNMCRQKHFDAIEFDNVDGYDNDTGFRLTANDQLRFNTWLANEAHLRGLSAALKNDIGQLKTLQPYFDWALNEECWEFGECTTGQIGYGYDKYVAAGKAVFNVEYHLPAQTFCPKSNRLNFNSLKKALDLDAYRVPCRGR
jgi:endo-alpha-1,4-polygalactosaminidase (GH114 family)